MWIYSDSLNFCRNGAGLCVFILPVDEPPESLGEMIEELISGLGVEAGKPLGFHDEPESFYRIQIR